MKAFSVKQPYAHLIVRGLKRLQPVSWPCGARGVVALHASSYFPDRLRRLCSDVPEISSALGGVRADRLIRGAFIGVVYVEDCLSVEVLQATGRLTRREQAFGNYRHDRYALVISQAVQLSKPILCVGRNGIWDVPDEAMSQELRMRGGLLERAARLAAEV